MTTNLTLSKTAATCSSEWTGRYIIGGSFEYTTPTTDYDNITVSVPEILRGATINSVTFSFSTSNVTGSKKVVFNDTRVSATNASLLARLQAGDMSIPLLFSYRAVGGTGGSGTHSETCRWTDLRIEVEYIPAAAVNGTVEMAGATVFYAIAQNSLAASETGDITLSITPASDATRIQVDIRPHGGSTFTTMAYDVVAPAGRQTTIQGTFPLTGLTLSSHVELADIRLHVTAGSETVSNWTETQLRLVRERYAPQISAAWNDLTDIHSRFGVYVQGKSRLRCSITVTLDTAADPAIASASRLLNIGGVMYTSGDGTFEVPTEALSGSNAYTLSVTDSYGQTGTAAGTLTVTAYRAPELTRLEIQRYVERTSETGAVYYEADDDGNRVWVTMNGAVSPVNGKNATTVTVNYAGADHALTSYSDGRAFSFDRDRSLITAQFAESQEWALTVTVSDMFGAASYAVLLPKAGAIFSIEKGGVAVGMRCTGTQTDRRFQCAYPATFTAGIFDADGKPIGGNKAEYILDTEQEVGTFFGQKLYRKCAQISSLSTSSSSPTSVDMGITPAHIVRIDGYVSTNSYGDLPINCYHSSSVRAFCRPDGVTGKLIAYTGSSNSGAVIIVEYTK